MALKSKHLKLLRVHNVCIVCENLSTGYELLVLRWTRSSMYLLSCSLSPESLIRGFTIDKVANLNMKQSKHRKDEQEANDEDN